MYVALMFIVCVLAYGLVNVLLVIIRNSKAHQFFATKSSKLPVLKNPGIFSGHMYSVSYCQKNWKIIDDLHNELGPTFGFYMCDQPWVSTKDIDLIKLIELEQPMRHINRCKLHLPFKEFKECIFQADDDEWRRVRRAVAPALTNHKVRSEEVSTDIGHVVQQLSESLDAKLREAASTTQTHTSDVGPPSIIVDAGDLFRRFALAVIFLTTYKRDGEIDFKAPKDEWVELLELSARMIRNPIIGLALMFPFARPLCSILVKFHQIGAVQSRIINYIVQATDIHKTTREQHQKSERRLSNLNAAHKERPFNELKRANGFRRRLVDTIIDSYVEKRIKYHELIGTAFFLLLAGFETTADTITCLVWHLAREPQIQEKLRKSIAEEGIDAEYLMWCIQETIRWHPAVPLGAGRILGENVTVNGIFLARGTFVMPSTYSIHHDESIWPHANEFIPERWRHSADFHPAAFMGFGLGPRNCVGGKLAVHEIKLVMQLLLAKFRIEKCAQTTDQYSFSSPGLVYTNLDEPIKIRLVALDQSKSL